MSYWDSTDAHTAVMAARALIDYQGREDQPSYFQRSIEMRYDKERAWVRKRAGAAFVRSIEGKTSRGGKALMYVAGLWAKQGDKDRREAQWELEQRAVQGRWEVGEGRRQDAAAFQQDQARQARSLNIFNTWQNLYDNAAKNPAAQKHYVERMKAFVGILSPKDKKMLEPFMAKGPLDPREEQRRFFRDKMGPPPPLAQLEEGETENSSAYKQRWAESYFARKKYDWLEKKTMGLEPGEFKESYVIGSEDGVTQYAVKKGDGAAYIIGADAYKWDQIEKELKLLPGTLERTEGKQWGAVVTKDIGHGIYSIKPYFDHTTGKAGVERELIGQKPLKREDLRMSIPNPPGGFEDFQTSLIGGLPSDEAPKTEGGRMYSTAYKFRENQMNNKAKRSAKMLDGEFRQMLEKMWPGHVVRYRYDKGTAKPSERTINPLTWGKGPNIFGDNPDIQLIPGTLSMARHPKKEGVWIRVVYDSTRGVIYVPDEDTNSWEPAMTDAEYSRKWGDYPLTLSEFKEREKE